MLLGLLVQSIEQFDQTIDAHKLHLRKMDSLPSMSSEGIREVIIFSCKCQIPWFCLWLYHSQRLGNSQYMVTFHYTWYQDD